jgi:hypothetical protein
MKGKTIIRGIAMWRKTHLDFGIIWILAVILLGCTTKSEEYSWSVEVGPDTGIQGQLAEKELFRAIEESGGKVANSTTADCKIDLDFGCEDLRAEGYQIHSTLEGGVLQISSQGRDGRGLLYAAFDLAERIRHGEPLEDLQLSQEPYSAYRQIAVCSCDHQFYARLIQAMPRWRMNALLLYSAYHQPGGWYVYKDLGRGWFSTYLTRHRPCTQVSDSQLQSA